MVSGSGNHVPLHFFTKGLPSIEGNQFSSKGFPSLTTQRKEKNTSPPTLIPRGKTEKTGGQRGVDLVVHSATKFFSGHADCTGGLVCVRDPAGEPRAPRAPRAESSKSVGALACRTFFGWVPRREWCFKDAFYREATEQPSFSVGTFESQPRPDLDTDFQGGPEQLEAPCVAVGIGGRNGSP